ncbi:PREDICTED: uncharacterized protein LOC108561902 isoform X2 [Nicrophorus vespilloides]|uniref:Uncharacterized protein LOC108561902 isoform X2 n=1 Tax=Nicrophorus vespilloides TaxID=110193 RepID=A0ABM1MLQ8_NICVS|nr:PREDICTED: uncharacterized protein LOC108561902 isoform X2 [Nicrophorus vespilloides]
MQKIIFGWAYVALICSSCIVSTLSYPNVKYESGSFVPARTPQLPSVRIERKFAEKPNAIKKVALDDLDDVNTNSIQESSGGFSWSNLLGMVMQMIFNTGGNQVGPNKSEGLDDGGIAPSPWANLLSVGLKIITAILGGGGGGGDGIDKVDNGSPMQGILAAVLSAVVGSQNPDQVNMMAKQAGEFINIVVNLLDALKTSFSHRSLLARNIGRKDTVSEATVAGISMMKGYVRSLSTASSKCMQKYLCDANRECTNDIGQTSIFCQLGTYATSFVLEKSTTGNSFDLLYEAGRRGRSGDNCHQAYLECNEV